MGIVSPETAAGGLIAVLFVLLLLLSRTGRFFLPLGSGGRGLTGFVGGGDRHKAGGGFRGGEASGSMGSEPRARNPLTPEDRERVEAALRDARGRLSGQIVPVVVERSHPYPHLAFVGGLLGALAASLVWVFLAVSTPLFLFVCQAVGFLAGFVCLRRLRPAARWLLSPRLAEEAVYERALGAFREMELNLARDRTGVLILVSLLERRVQVLADSGINARVKPGTWGRVVERLVQGVREGSLCDGLCSAIERCAEILERPDSGHITDPTAR